MAKAARMTLCSFCGKSQSEVERLIAGQVPLDRLAGRGGVDGIGHRGAGDQDPDDQR